MGMALDADEILKLELILEACRDEDTFNSLTEWEQGFVVSTDERYKEYKDNTRVSTKQWGVLDRIYDKVMA